MTAEAGFADRRDAGRKLGAALRGMAGEEPLVLALPRGGVPVAHEVAAILGAPLDLLLVRKLGAPGHAEYGIGALVDGPEPQRVMNEEAMQLLAPSPDYVEAETRRQLVELERRRRVYFGDRAATPVAGRVVVLVDDGIATGGTIRAALRALRQGGAAKVVVAVPVAPREVLTRLEAEADAVICLLTPEPFRAVGFHYDHFEQTTDAEVIRLLNEARATASAAPEARS